MLIPTLFTQEQKDVIAGTLLGDASLERTKPSHNPRIRFEQTYPDHESYLLSLNNIFKEFVGTSPRIHVRKPDKRTNKVYSTIAFKSLRVIELNYYYDLFYTYDNLGKRKKVVPINIGE